MSLTNVRPTRIDDVVLWEADNARESVLFKNNSGSTGSFLVARTVVYSVSAGAYVQANVNHADAVLLTNTDSLANNATQQVTVVGLRGNCTLNIDAIDYGPGGTAFDTDAQAQVNDLAARGCKMVQQPDINSNG